VKASNKEANAKASERDTGYRPEERGQGFASLAGIWRGQVQIADEFDELPEDLADALGRKL